MASYTANYGLHQWEAADNFLRTDFNTDHQLIDAALAGKAEMVTGSYVGDGVDGRTISLGFKPRAVVIKNPNHQSDFGHTNEVSFVPAIATAETPSAIFSIVDGGFQLSAHGLVNGGSRRFIYLAFA